MASPVAPSPRRSTLRHDRLSLAVESGSRSLVIGSAGLARSALRGLQSGLRTLRERDGHNAGEAPGQRTRLLAELEEARRLGRWHTEEDKALLREHEARLAAERRAAGLQQVGRRGSLALLLVAWFVPVLWPLAIAGSFVAFPRTSRRLLLALLGLGAASALALTLMLGHWLGGAEPPPAPSLPPAGLGEQGSAGLGRRLAERLEREADYWEYVTPAQEGPGMLRKGVFRTWNGRPVMVMPRPAWLALEPIERRALAEHLRSERGIEAIHVGRLVPSSRFEGQAIAVEERVWP
jgi:hypothetical protein